jgi:hypothetical protein
VGGVSEAAGSILTMRLDTRQLNRALLARQGLLTPLDADRKPGPDSVVRAVEAIGPVQAQYWPATAASLAARLTGFEPAHLYSALEDGDLLTGTLIRATLHMTSAQHHAAYAAVAEASKACAWRRVVKEPTGDPVAGGDELRAALAAWCDEAPRPRQAVEAFVEGWVAAHPGAVPEEEAAWQRQHGWRPVATWAGVVRVGRFDGAKGPEEIRAAPVVPGTPGAPSPEDALDTALLNYLRAFGPAAVDDAVQFFAWKPGPVREALARLGDRLAAFTDESGRELYDLPDAPRPGAEADAPARLLPWFDSTLLAYAPNRRTRILPEGTWAKVYRPAGLRIDPAFLVDGFVAGLWSVKATARKASVALAPFGTLSKAVKAGLEAEAQRMAAALYPGRSAEIGFAS